MHAAVRPGLALPVAVTLPDARARCWTSVLWLVRADPFGSDADGPVPAFGLRKHLEPGVYLFDAKPQRVSTRIKPLDAGDRHLLPSQTIRYGRYVCRPLISETGTRSGLVQWCAAANRSPMEVLSCWPA
jgi:hypothetical protein